jgi:AcrR family transcriptional regulator
MPAKAPRRRPEEDGSTRERLLDVALQAFAELGYDGASTRAIAARAGVNQGLIPYYFGTKETLWREAVDRAFAELRAVFAAVQAEPVEDAQRVELLIRRFVDFVARRPEFARLMTEEGKRDGPRMRWIVDRHVRPLFEAIQALARGNRVLARLASGPGAPILHYILVGAATQLFHQGPEFRRLTGLDPAAPALIRAHADALVALFVRGVAPTRPA